MGTSSIHAFLLLQTVILSLSITGTRSAIFTLTISCPYTVWPGVLTSSGTPVDPTGFELAPGTSFSLIVAAGWSGRLWGRTHCTLSGTFTCAVGDCGSGQVACDQQGGAPPVTLAEFTLNRGGGLDFYDISVVDGFNLPMSVYPKGGQRCRTTGCRADINKICPKSLAVRDDKSTIIACKSACLAFGKEQYCCTGSHSTAQTCPPTNYSKIFKRQCRQAYTYAYDDKTATFTCPSGGDYVVTFCP